MRKIWAVSTLIIILFASNIHAESVPIRLIDQLWFNCGQIYAEGDFKGSGIYIGDGIFLTCKHVILTDNNKLESALTIKINGTHYTPYSIQLATTDIALLKIPIIRGLERIEFSEIVIGEEVIVIGTFGYPFPVRVVVRGIASGFDKDDIYSDVSVLPGMSGAPVFNMRGQLVGLLQASISSPLIMWGEKLSYHWRMSVVIPTPTLPDCPNYIK